MAHRSSSLLHRVAPLLFAGALFAAPVQSAFADPRDFVLENDSYATYIEQIYVAPSDSDSWGPDLLGQDVLGPMEVIHISFSARDMHTCYYDILVVSDAGRRTRNNSVNLCQLDSVSYSD